MLIRKSTCSNFKKSVHGPEAIDIEDVINNNIKKKTYADEKQSEEKL